MKKIITSLLLSFLLPIYAQDNQNFNSRVVIISNCRAYLNRGHLLKEDDPLEIGLGTTIMIVPVKPDIKWKISFVMNKNCTIRKGNQIKQFIEGEPITITNINYESDVFWPIKINVTATKSINDEILPNVETDNRRFDYYQDDNGDVIIPVKEVVNKNSAYYFKQGDKELRASNNTDSAVVILKKDQLTDLIFDKGEAQLSVYYVSQYSDLSKVKTHITDSLYIQKKYK